MSVVLNNMRNAKLATWSFSTGIHVYTKIRKQERNYTFCWRGGGGAWQILNMVAQHCTLCVRQERTNVSTSAYTIFFLVHNFLPLDTNNLKFLTRCKDASILTWQRYVIVTKVTKVESYFYNCQRHVTQGPPVKGPGM